MSDNINVKVNEANKETVNVNAPAESEVTKKLTQTAKESLESIVAPAEEKAVERLTPEYIMAQIEKLLADKEHIADALGELHSVELQQPYGGVVDLAGKARMDAIADVVKCRETTLQQALSFYKTMYEDIKPSPLDIAIAQAERILSAPMYEQYHSPETKGCHERELHDTIMEAFKKSLQNKKEEESSLEFKRRAIMEQVRCQEMSPQEIAELFAILDN